MTHLGRDESATGLGAEVDAGGERRRRVDAVPDPRYLYSPEEAARRLGISRTRVYQLFHTQWLTAIKIGRRTLIADKEVQQLIDRMLQDPGLLSHV
jgi:excisionase family DNA binding protein